MRKYLNSATFSAHLVSPLSLPTGPQSRAIVPAAPSRSYRAPAVRRGRRLGRTPRHRTDRGRRRLHRNNSGTQRTRRARLHRRATTPLTAQPSPSVSVTHGRETHTLSRNPYKIAQKLVLSARLPFLAMPPVVPEPRKPTASTPKRATVRLILSVEAIRLRRCAASHRSAGTHGRETRTLSRIPYKIAQKLVLSARLPCLAMPPMVPEPGKPPASTPVPA